MQKQPLQNFEYISKLIRACQMKKPEKLWLSEMKFRQWDTGSILLRGLQLIYQMPALLLLKKKAVYLKGWKLFPKQKDIIRMVIWPVSYTHLRAHETRH